MSSSQSLAAAYAVKRKAQKKAQGGTVQADSVAPTYSEGGTVAEIMKRRSMGDNDAAEASLPGVETEDADGFLSGDDEEPGILEGIMQKSRYRMMGKRE